MLELDFQFIDRGYVKPTTNEYMLVQKKNCVCCHEEKGRGFDVNNAKPVNPVFHQGVRGSFLGFVCLDCIYDFLHKQGIELRSPKDVGFFNLDLPKKYAQIYMRYKQGRFPEEHFLIQKVEFSSVMHDEFVEAIETLVDYDLEYGEKIHLGTEWRGWWMGLTGEEIKIFFGWLQSAIKHNYEDIEEKFKSEYGTRKVSEAISLANKIYKMTK